MIEVYKISSRKYYLKAADIIKMSEDPQDDIKGLVSHVSDVHHKVKVKIKRIN